MAEKVTDAPRGWPDSDKGIKAAREWAQWHIGDSAWADDILYAYLNPERAQAQLSAERDAD